METRNTKKGREENTKVMNRELLHVHKSPSGNKEETRGN